MEQAARGPPVKVSGAMRCLALLQLRAEIVQCGLGVDAATINGGKNLGFQHGSHLSYSDDIPLSNLFVTIANQFSKPTDKFADSTADITEVLG